ncbi:MAG: SDR family NAD(P)-dependent oxidoreductase, partial [Candidatus Limnocylindria bacterium]
STGMAASAAKALASEGGRVFIVSRTAEHAAALADEIATSGGRAAWHGADLSREAEAEAAVQACAEELGGLEVVYNVAGISGRRLGDGPVHQASMAGWETVLATNLTSMFLVCRAVIRRMLAQDADADGHRGAILNMSSALARHPSPLHFGTHAYAASKGGIEALTRSLAATYAPHGIRVNAIAPALVATPMSRRAQDDDAILAYLATKQPLARGPIEADDVTPTALHLLSGDARMITGQVVDVDGGWGVTEAG